jgi:glycosyltransferase involved in cell wall biosynthesis
MCIFTFLRCRHKLSQGMKVLFIANINSSHTSKWALALRERGVSVAIVSLVPVRKTTGAWFKKLDAFYSVPFKSKFLLQYPAAMRAIKKMIRTFDPDVIHSHYLTNHTFTAGFMRLHPHVSTAWGSDVYIFPKKNSLTRLMLRLNLKVSDRIISTSYAMAAELGLYTQKQVAVIPFGIDLKQFSYIKEKRVNNNSTIRIGCFKLLEEIYAPEILLQTFAKLKEKLPGTDLQLVIAGSGSLQRSCEQLANDLFISSHVEFRGWVQPENVPGLLSDMHLCVYLSRNESFGVSLLEAMACGVPLVVTRTPGFIEVSGIEECVSFVNFDDPDDAAEKIEEMINNPVLYEERRKAGRRRVEDDYDLDKNIQQQMTLYNQVTAKKINGGDQTAKY